MQGRISAIAGIHRRLYTSARRPLGGNLGLSRSLLDDLEATRRRPATLDHPASGRPTEAPTDKAVLVGVVVTELVTNASSTPIRRHGGEIRVVVRRMAHKVNLAVEDDGIGWTGEGPAKAPASAPASSMRWRAGSAPR